ACQIGQNRNRLTLFGRHLSNPSDNFREPVISSMSEVQSKNIDAGLDQLSQLLERSRRRSNGRDDFRFDQRPFRILSLPEIHLGVILLRNKTMLEKAVAGL